MSTPRMDKTRRTNSAKVAMVIMSMAARGATSRWCVMGGDRELAACLAKKYGGANQCEELTRALTDEVACALLGGRLLVARINGYSHYELPTSNT